MFKPVHGIEGALTSALNAAATVMFVDDSTLCLLKKRLLEGGDYTYLMLRQAYDYEIVKTAGFSANGVSIERGQDDTTPQAFPVGTEIQFVLGATAIADLIADRGLAEVNITGKGIVTVTKIGINEYTISAPPISISSDSPNVLVGGDFPNFVLSAPLLVDCCD